MRRTFMPIAAAVMAQIALAMPIGVRLAGWSVFTPDMVTVEVTGGDRVAVLAGWISSWPEILTAAGGDRGPLLLRQLRKSVYPSGTDPVRRGGIDHPDGGVLDQGDGLPGSVIGQAEENDVRSVQEFSPLLPVVSFIFIDPEQGQVLSFSDPFIDLQPCGPALSVYIYSCLHSALCPFCS